MSTSLRTEEELEELANKIVFTGMIDQYFNYNLEHWNIEASI